MMVGPGYTLVSRKHQKLADPFFFFLFFLTAFHDDYEPIGPSG